MQGHSVQEIKNVFIPFASTRSTRNVCMCEYCGFSHIIQMMFYNSDIIFNASVTQTWDIHFIMYSATQPTQGASAVNVIRVTYVGCPIN